MIAAPPIPWPDGRAFAFSVFDDTDMATLENAPPVYDLLTELGLRTTKSVWPLGVDDPPGAHGSTCADEAYLEWVRSLQAQGFEIALHNVGPRTSERERTIAGIERFRELFGEYPVTHTNHIDCRENIYWGEERLTGVNRAVYNALNRYRMRGLFNGHDERSRLFWGDVCRDRVKYVRNFVHRDINTLRFCPQMPYHDPRRPFVNLWFASTEGPDVETFVGALSDRAQDRLEAEGGACIMYTHFGVGFAPGGRLDARFARQMRRLAERNGWFVPVSTLLDHLLAVKGRHVLADRERASLERRWLAHKVRVRGSS